MPWFLTLFTALPCWDSVLAAWDLIILHGLSAVFRIALTIMDLLEPRLMEQSDEGAVLPLLLRVPVDVAKYTVLVPALWNTEVQDWEIKCMNSLVLDESHHGSKTDMCEKQTSSMSNQTIEDKDEENTPVLSGGGKPTEKDSVTRAKSVLSRVMRLAQRYLIDPMGRQRAEEKSSQVKTRQRSPAAGRVLRSRTSASLTKAQIRSRRRGQQEGRAHQPTLQGSAGDVTVTDPAAGGKSDGGEQTFRRAATEPLGKAARHHGNHSLRVKSLRLLRSGKNQTPSPSSSFPPPSLRSSTLPPTSSIPASNPPSSGASQSREEPEQKDTPSMAFIRELSSRHQISVPLRDARESTLI